MIDAIVGENDNADQRWRNWAPEAVPLMGEGA
jgi:hypothetical protein